MSKPDYEYYGILATSWDAFRGDTSAWDDRSFYLEAIHRFGEPALDVGCATGRLLIDFQAQGIDVEGVDVSPEMVALCRDNGARAGIPIRVHLQKMEELEVDRQFRCILVPSSSFQLLVDRAAPALAMRRFVDHLQHGGALVMPFMTLRRGDDPLETEAVDEVTRQGDSAILRRTSRSRFDPASSLEHTDDLYEVIVGGRVTEVERHIRSPSVRSYTQGEARALFEDAGLEDVTVLKGFTWQLADAADGLFSIVGLRG
ncbi:MAG: class I SAM-dependent methyltransferase [Actinomycetota bacterium]